MNKILRVVLLGAALSYAATGKLNAQELNQGLSFMNFKFDPSYKMNTSALAVAYDMYTDSGNDELNKAKSDLKAKKMYFKTLKASNRASVEFGRSFKHIKNAEWQIQKEAIVASFTENEIRNYIVYDKSGRWVRNMAYLFENKIPETLKRDVQHAYPDYKINMALEITERDIKLHVVFLENEYRIKHITVANDEILEIDEYMKAK